MWISQLRGFWATLRLCAYLTLVSTVAYADAHQCKLIVASRTSLEESIQLARDYDRRFSSTELVEVQNGRFAISLGTLSQTAGSDVSEYISTYRLPSDSFCMQSTSVVRYIEFRLAESEPETISPQRDRFGLLGCPRGYKPIGFPVQQCRLIVVPPNAELDYSGNGWFCSRGYRRTGDTCEFIEVPENAQLTPNFGGLSGSKGWACNRGFRDLGESCEQITIPDNATLSVFGNRYTCNTGFRDTGQACTAMTYDELYRDLVASKQLLAGLFSRTTYSCSQVVDLCEDTCRTEFSYSSSPTKRECEEVCEEIEDEC